MFELLLESESWLGTGAMLVTRWIEYEVDVLIQTFSLTIKWIDWDFGTDIGTDKDITLTEPFTKLTSSKGRSLEENQSSWNAGQ